MNKYPKSKYPYKVQHLGYPTTKIIRENQWKDCSFHTSKKAAFNAIIKYRSHLDLWQWDDHYRITDRYNNIIRKTDKEFYEGIWEK